MEATRGFYKEERRDLISMLISMLTSVNKFMLAAAVFKTHGAEGLRGKSEGSSAAKGLKA